MKVNKQELQEELNKKNFLVEVEDISDSPYGTDYDAITIEFEDGSVLDIEFETAYNFDVFFDEEDNYNSQENHDVKVTLGDVEYYDLEGDFISEAMGKDLEKLITNHIEKNITFNLV